MAASFEPTQMLVMVLAGGEGKRLYPLTLDRAKPAVPFGGRYRIIDIVLSNFVNSGLAKVKILTQYKSASLDEHIARVWRLSPILDQFIEAVPAQQRTGKTWYRGSADAVFQCQHGVLETDADGKILAFHEKVKDPPGMPGNPGMCLASMGNYIFSKEAILREV